MRILITGSSGFIGSALVRFLRSKGHEITRLVRRMPPLSVDEIYWNPEESVIDCSALEGHDAVVHLAGENIASGWWTRERKARLRDSRVQSTLLLAESLAALTNPPHVFVSASAIGYYGNRDDEILREDSPPGTGFLARLGQEWEAAATPAREAGIRVAHPRISVVLDPAGGALARMLPLFKWGLGGIIGSGNQYMSWIALEDLLRAILFVIEKDDLNGPWNAAAPGAVTNREFTHILARVLKRPAFLPVPAIALRALLGEMAQETILASARVEPAHLLASGFLFNDPNLPEALQRML